MAPSSLPRFPAGCSFWKDKGWPGSWLHGLDRTWALRGEFVTSNAKPALCV